MHVWIVASGPKQPDWSTSKGRLVKAKRYMVKLFDIYSFYSCHWVSYKPLSSLPLFRTLYLQPIKIMSSALKEQRVNVKYIFNSGKFSISHTTVFLSINVWWLVCILLIMYKVLLLRFVCSNVRFIRPNSKKLLHTKVNVQNLVNRTVSTFLFQMVSQIWFLIIQTNIQYGSCVLMLSAIVVWILNQWSLRQNLDFI